MCRPPSSGCVRRRACGLPYPASGRRSRPSVALHVCFLTGAPRYRRPGRCSPFRAPIPPASSGVRRVVGGDSPARRPGADGRCVSPVTLLCTPSPRPFWACHCRLCWSSAGGVGVPSSAGNGAGSSRWSPLPPLRRRSNSDHAGKSSYSGEIDYRFLTFQTGSRFSGSRLTSLVQDLCLNIYHVQLAVNLHHTFSYVADSICNIVVLDKATWYRPIVCFM